MWPIIYGLATRYSRYLVFPIAAVIGTVGYYAEKKLMPKPEPIPYLEASVQEQRERRLGSSAQPTDFESYKNSLNVLKPRSV